MDKLEWGIYIVRIYTLSLRTSLASLVWSLELYALNYRASMDVPRALIANSMGMILPEYRIRLRVVL